MRKIEAESEREQSKDTAVTENKKSLKIKLKTFIAKDSFIGIRAFFATVKQSAAFLFSKKKAQETKFLSSGTSDDGQENSKPSSTAHVASRKPKQAKTAAKEPRRQGRLFIAVDIILIIALSVSGAFCYYSLTVDDGRQLVILNSGGRTSYHMVWQTTVGEFLSENNIELKEGDKLSQPLEEDTEHGMTVTLERAFPVAVESASEVTIVKMTEGTVGDALEAAGVEYDVDDELSELPFEDAEAGMHIQHTDVKVDYKTSYEELEYKERTVKDATMYKGQSKVVTQGENGEKRITRRVTYKDGFEFSREIVDQVILKEAIDKIINIGSKTRYQTSYVGEWREYKQPPVAGKNGWVEMKMDYITAYSGDKVTSRGTVPKLGTIAVTPQYIPYYSQIYVKNYGYGTALDTGAFRNRFENGKRVNQLDLFFNTEAECRRWGRKRNVTVLVKLNK